MRATVRLVPILVLALIALNRAAIAQVQGDALGKQQVQADYLGKKIADVRLEIGGQVTTEAELREVLETRVDDTLRMTDVRESLVHLMALGRFENVEVVARAEADGRVTLVYQLIPIRTVRSMVFKGRLDLDQNLLRGEVTDRYGSAPALGRADDIARMLEGVYRDHGFAIARVTPHVDITAGSRATLAFDVEHGPRAVIGNIRVEGDNGVGRTELYRRLGIGQGVAYDPSEVTKRSSALTDSLRNEGFYEATVEVTPRFVDETTVNLDVIARRGRRVTVQVTGDIQKERVNALVPIKTEKSVDEDLLEDWSANIVRSLQNEGYRYAEAPYSRGEQGGQLRIVFAVKRGAQHIIDAVKISGNSSMTEARILAIAKIQAGKPMVERAVDDGAAAVAAQYVAEGFSGAKVQRVITTRSNSPAEARDEVLLQVTEGIRTTVRSVRVFVDGTETALSELPGGVTLGTKPGAAYFVPSIVSDRDALYQAYVNQGYQMATVSVPDVKEMIGTDKTRADVRFDVRRGPQVLVDHILIVGNTRTKSATIRKELQVEPNQPIAPDKLRESEQRLTALGLFRRVRVVELQHGSEVKRDVLVIVDEAPATSIAYGGGVEGAKRLRRDAAGNAVPAIELAPRGLFEIGRRNLWGKNRSITFNGSMAVRPNSTSVVGTGLREYRAIGTYQEPRILNGAVDFLMTGGVEQTVRTSYSFNRRSVYAQLAHTLSPTLSVYGRYSIERTNVFNEQVSPEERLLIDIRFPQVRISRLSSSIVSDSRDDQLDPSTGVLAFAEGSLAPRMIGSEVGFTRTLMQAFIYRRLPGSRRIVFAGGARVGLATGFSRTTSTGEIVRDVPISERFFSGNAVRGFVEDRLGRPDTLTPEGFPNGGNALLIFNAELRTTLFKDFAAVTFLDAGNVFLHASQLNPAQIRPGVGLGLRYKSPIGPIRLDVGFNPSRHTFGNGTREPLSSLYFGIGQAF